MAMNPTPTLDFPFQQLYRKANDILKGIDAAWEANNIEEVHALHKQLILVFMDLSFGSFTVSVLRKAKDEAAKQQEST
jgi:hypothetical protein